MSDGALPRIGIVVLGMHRAGTSLLGQILGRLGCDPPRTLIGPSANNEGGYWESHAVVAFNDRLLTLAGTAWDDWQDVPAALPDKPALQDEAAGILADEFGASPLFVLKDPRICRLAPFWLARLDAAGIAHRVILALRNPIEVAASLVQRNAIEPQLGHLMWLRHMLAAEAATRGMARVVTDYDALHADWQGVMGRAGRMLGLGWSLPPGQIAGEADIVNPGLRHHQSTAAALGADPALPAGLARAHAILHRWTTEAETDTDHAELDTIRVQLDRDAAAFGPLVALGRRRAVALRAAERRMAGLDAARAAAEAARDRLKQERDKSDAKSASPHPGVPTGVPTGTSPDVTADLRRILDIAMADLRTQTEARAGLVADHGREMLAHTAEVAQLSALVHKTETDLAETCAVLEQARTETRAALAATRHEMDARQRKRTQAADAVQILLALRRAEARTGLAPGLWPRRLRQTWQLAAIRETGLFDPQFYLATNPDVAAAGTDPGLHYLHHGLVENRPPNAGLRTRTDTGTDPVLPRSATDRQE